MAGEGDQNRRFSSGEDSRFSGGNVRFGGGNVQFSGGNVRFGGNNLAPPGGPARTRLRRPDRRPNTNRTISPISRQATNPLTDDQVRSLGERVVAGQDVLQRAGLSDQAVLQEKGRYDFVSDPATGFSVPNLADDETKLAFNRFFADRGDESLLGDLLPSGPLGRNQDQILRDSDPTRVDFQGALRRRNNRFQTTDDAALAQFGVKRVVSAASLLNRGKE